MYFEALEGWILFVTHLHEEATEDNLMDLFGEFGDIQNLHMNIDRRTGFIKVFLLLSFYYLKNKQK